MSGSVSGKLGNDGDLFLGHLAVGDSVGPELHGAETGLAGDEVEFRSYRIVEGEVTEEDVEVVESYLFGHSPTTVVYD